MIWLLFGTVTLIVVAGLLWPLLRSFAPAAADRSAYDMMVFRDQLLELDRDVERGVITTAEAEAARLEIQRRLLAAGKELPVPVRTDAPGQRAALTAAIAVLVPFAALGVYLTVGAPQLIGKAAQHATQDPAGGHTDAEMAALVDKLAARVRETPNDPEGWSLLARSERQLERFADAGDAYKHLIALQPDQADGYAGFGEAAIGAAGGTVTPEAHDAFVHALQIDRSEPRSRFYLGLEQAQAGNAKNAIAIWREMTASAPADAPWVNTVREQMGAVAQDAGIMPMSVPPRHALEVVSDASSTPAAGAAPPPVAEKQMDTAPSAAADPAAPDLSAIKDRFTPQQQEMIKGMVGGLAARLAADPDNPANYDGWMRLGRAYTVLANTAGAKDAYGHAIKLNPQDLAPKLQLADLLVHETDFDAALPPALVRIARDIHALNADQPDALFILGVDKARNGDSKGARTMWQSALAAAPPNTPLHDEITRRMAALR